MLTPELETKALLGRGVNDIYGRFVGRVIGIDRNPFGEMEGVQVESVGNSIITFKARQIALTPKAVTVTPEWKLEVEDVVSELSTLRKRVTALEQLNDAREIDGEIYAEILEAQRAGYLERVKMGEALAGSVKSQLGTVAGQIASLTKHLVNAKLDHKSGQLDDAALKLAQSSIEPSLRPLIGEKNDLALALRKLEGVLPSRVSLSETDSPLPSAAKSAR
ncbi:hypothetical protein E6H29_01570 [Candidatus Bathyarchaeota archaeon]|nr:MAG: hypothetical protein E6H29_01570 [Candidatus Bathyarchaeota archaeon]